jgi:PAS domain-containing protein
MGVLKYDIPRPDGGGFEERYWSPIHTPVFGPDGGVAYVIQRPEDVTEFVRLKARAGESDRHEEELRGRAEQMEAEVFLRGQELAKANADLRRQVAERERVEEALAREQDFLRAVLDHAADGIVACDGDGVLRFFNGAARAFHGAAERPLPPERWAEQYDLYLPDGTTRMDQGAGALVPGAGRGVGEGRGDGDRGTRAPAAPADRERAGDHRCRGPQTRGRRRHARPDGPEAGRGAAGTCDPGRKPRG